MRRRAALAIATLALLSVAPDAANAHGALANCGTVNHGIWRVTRLHGPVSCAKARALGWKIARGPLHFNAAPAVPGWRCSVLPPALTVQFLCRLGTSSVEVERRPELGPA